MSKGLGSVERDILRLLASDAWKNADPVKRDARPKEDWMRRDANGYGLPKRILANWLPMFSRQSISRASVRLERKGLISVARTGWRGYDAIDITDAGVAELAKFTTK